MKKLVELFRKIIADIGSDSLLHFCVSALLVFMLGFIKPTWLLALIVFVIGIAKEVIDIIYAKDRSSVLKDSFKDLFCDMMGIALAVGFMMINGYITL